MKRNRHTIQELYQWQALPLSIKVSMTRDRIRGWVNEYGEDGVYISFSGGKDSTVLLDIVRRVCGYNRIPAAFVDVPTQYPELREFARTFDNVEELHAEMSFYEVCERYGFPLISKEVSDTVDGARKYLTRLEQRNSTLTDSGIIPGAPNMADIIGIDRRENKENKTYKNLMMGIIPNIEDAPVRYKILIGKLEHKENGVPTGEISKMYDKSRYKFFLDAPFDISVQCCKVMKKKPIHQYAKKTGRKPMTAQMASESRLRTQKWLQSGCNAFDGKNPISNPLSFWTEQDILTYIVKYDLQICSVYKDIVEDYGNDIDGQMTLADYGLFDKKKKYKTTGCKRTGCMLCGFGCHLEKCPNRFQKLKETHPGMYALLDKVKNSGVTMREAIDWTNEHGNLSIAY